jgi:hypothetical protein
MPITSCPRARRRRERHADDTAGARYATLMVSFFVPTRP